VIVVAIEGLDDCSGTGFLDFVRHLKVLLCLAVFFHSYTVHSFCVIRTLAFSACLDFLNTNSASRTGERTRHARDAVVVYMVVQYKNKTVTSFGVYHHVLNTIY
jgi:hypothetical protein